jgi:hypothetical protein
MGMNEILLSALVGLVTTWIAAEAKVGFEPLIRFLIRRAARAAPKEDRVGLEAEWLAHAAELKSPARRLAHAAHLWAFSGRIARALGVEGRLRRKLAIAAVYASMIVASVAIAPMLLSWLLLLRMTRLGPVFEKRTRTGRDGSEIVEWVVAPPTRSIWLPKGILNLFAADMPFVLFECVLLRESMGQLFVEHPEARATARAQFKELFRAAIRRYF